MVKARKGARTSSMKHAYFVVAKFSSSSNLSIESAEQSIKTTLRELGPDIQPEIVQIGEL